MKKLCLLLAALLALYSLTACLPALGEEAGSPWSDLLGIFSRSGEPDMTPAPQSTPVPETGGAMQSFFSGLFGGGSAAPAPTAAPAAQPTQAPTVPWQYQVQRIGVPHQVVDDPSFLKQVIEIEEAPPGYTPVRNADDLLRLASNPAGHYILMSDIDLSYRAEVLSALSRVTFSGILEGNGKTVSWNDMTYEMNQTEGELNAALFGGLRNAEVRNLHVLGHSCVEVSEALLYSGESLEDLGLGEYAFMLELYGLGDLAGLLPHEQIATQLNVGGLAGVVSGKTWVHNCACAVDFYYSDTTAAYLVEQYEYDNAPFYAGGVAAQVRDGSGTVFSYCANLAEWDTISYTGGIVGRNDGIGTRFVGCENQCNMSAMGSSLGGIVGWSLNDCQITGCANWGCLSADHYVGGIAGSVAEGGGSGLIDTCGNYGNIEGLQQSFWGIQLLAFFDGLTELANEISGGDIGSQITAEERQYMEQVRQWLKTSSLYKYDTVGVGGILGMGDVRVEQCVNFAPVETQFFGGMGICGSNTPSKVKECRTTSIAPGFVGDTGIAVSGAVSCGEFEETSAMQSFRGQLDYSPLGWTDVEAYARAYPAALTQDRWLDYANPYPTNELEIKDIQPLRVRNADGAYTIQRDREQALTAAMDEAVAWGDSRGGVLLDKSALEGVVLCFLEGYGEAPDCGFETSGKPRSSALCVVYKGGKIVFASEKCATFPDQPTNPASNAGSSTIPTVKDGIYKMKNAIHGRRDLKDRNGIVYKSLTGYPAMNVVTPDVIRVRSNLTSYSDTSYGINIHAKSEDRINVNSTGCTIVGDAGCVSSKDYALPSGNEYCRFAYVVGFAPEAGAGEGYAIIKDKAPGKAQTVVAVYNRSYGYDHSASFREGFLKRYANRQDIVDEILRRKDTAN